MYEFVPAAVVCGSKYECFQSYFILYRLTIETYLQYVSVETTCVRKCKVCCRGNCLSVFRSRYGT